MCVDYRSSDKHGPFSAAFKMILPDFYAVESIKKGRKARCTQ